MMRAPGKALQIRFWMHGGHVVGLVRHCERRNSR
jgi:hypothetical protein